MSWRLQSLLGFSVGAILCSVIALSDDDTAAYTFALAVTVAATLAGMLLRDVRRLLSTCVAMSVAALAVPLLWRGWLGPNWTVWLVFAPAVLAAAVACAMRYALAVESDSRSAKRVGTATTRAAVDIGNFLKTVRVPMAGCALLSAGVFAATVALGAPMLVTLFSALVCVVLLCSAAVGLVLADNRRERRWRRLAPTLPRRLSHILTGRIRPVTAGCVLAGAGALGAALSNVHPLTEHAPRAWQLGLGCGLAGGALLCAPTLMSRRDGRLIAPVAFALALTALASALTFYARPSPFRDGDEHYAWLQAPPHNAPAPRRLHVDYSFHGCSHPVTVSFSYDPAPHVVRSADSPADAIRADVGDPFRHQAAARHNAVRSLYHGFAQHETSKALPLRRRGLIGSCYFQLPAFLGPWAGAPRVYERNMVRGTVPLLEADNTLELAGSSLTVLSGESPTVAGDPSTWTCAASIEKKYASASVQPTAPLCSAVVMLTDSWYSAWQNLMLVILGGLLAAVAGLAGRAAAGYGWFSVEDAPAHARISAPRSGGSSPAKRPSQERSKQRRGAPRQ